MGKAAENERIKLRAAFYNNMAVASAAGGALIPLIGFLPRVREFGRWARAWSDGNAQVETTEALNVLVFVLTLVLAFLISGFLRDLSDRTAAKIHD